MTYLKDLILTARPNNCVLAFFAVIVGGISTYGNAGAQSVTIEALLFLLIGATSAMCIAAGGYIVNDLFDLPIDIINAPHRPIPSGRVTVQAAKLTTIFLFAVGVGMAFLTRNVLVILIAIFGAFGSYRYSTDLKRTGFFGNLTVAALCFLLFVYGGALVQNYLASLFPASFAFLTMLAREIVKGVEDVEGDASYGVHTLAVSYGVKRATITASLLMLMIMVLMPIPIILNLYSSLIYVIFMIILYIIFVLTILSILKGLKNAPAKNEEIIQGSFDKHYATYSKKMLKIASFIGLIDFLLSSLLFF